MSNLNHGNDKIKAPLCDSNNDGNQFGKKMHYLKSLFQSLETAYGGFYRAKNYSVASIEKHLRDDGEYQMRFYLHLFGETLVALSALLEGMQADSDTNMEGK